MLRDSYMEEGKIHRLLYDLNGYIQIKKIYR